MSPPILLRCPALDIPMLVAEHDTVVAPSCSHGIGLFWPCIVCDAVHFDPLTPADFDRMTEAGFDFVRALEAGVDR